MTLTQITEWYRLAVQIEHKQNLADSMLNHLAAEMTPDILRELRRSANLTQAELARILGVSQSAVHFSETGVIRLSPKYASGLLRAVYRTASCDSDVGDTTAMSNDLDAMRQTERRSADGD